MDMGFATRDRLSARAGAMPVRVDHRLLLATLAAAQSAGIDVVAAARLRVPAPLDARAALVALFNRDVEWSAAAAALGGSFAPGTATAIAGKARSTLMKARFTLAF